MLSIIFLQTSRSTPKLIQKIDKSVNTHELCILLPISVYFVNNISFFALFGFYNNV